MSLTELNAVTSIDGRYGSRTKPLRDYFSEFGLIKYRVMVELEWLKCMSCESGIPEVPIFNEDTIQFIDSIWKNFSFENGSRVKEIEKTTNHDMKAVEYFIKEQIEDHPVLGPIKEFIHFGCTSEDINNLAYSCLTRDAIKTVVLPLMEKVVDELVNKAEAYASTPLLSRTHGQPATPTTFGREFAVFANRLQNTISRGVRNARYMGKFNGAIGAFNAHLMTHPLVNWEELARHFVEDSLKLTYQKYSTQIEPHDDLAFLLDACSRFCSIMTDLSTDCWTYISRDLLKLKTISGEIGSSTMPHKVNPIDFENAEGNAGLACAIFTHLSAKLTKSRLQRDLSDSSALRAQGTAFGHLIVTCDSCLRGLSKVSANELEANAELDRNWAVLAEPIQMVLRRAGVATPYEQLKELTRGKTVGFETIRAFVEAVPAGLSDEDRSALFRLTPASYIGIAEKLAREVRAEVQLCRI